jgi:hypothetical protein
VQKLILLILVGVWAAVLVPPALRSRVHGRPGDSISDFNRRLDILGRTRNTRRSAMPRIGARAPRAADAFPSAPRASRSVPLVTRTPVLRTPPMSPAARRRRDVFVLLLAAVAASFLVAVLLSGWFWALHLLVDLALGVYVALLVQLRNVAAQRKLSYPPLRALDPLDRPHAPSSESRLHLVRAASR